MSLRASILIGCFVIPAIIVGTCPSAHARVVVSEVCWMGSDRRTADEWLEIAGVDDGDLPRSLSGWTIVTIMSGEERVIAQFGSGAAIGSGQYLVIANNSAEDSVLLDEPYLVTSAMQLSNTNLLLELRSSTGAVVDVVGDGGKPFAGENASGTGVRATMERVDLRLQGGLNANWRNAEAGVGFDPGVAMRGTPGAAHLPFGSSVSSTSSATSSSGASSSIASSSASHSLHSSVGISSSASSASSASASSAVSQGASSSIISSAQSQLPVPHVLINEALANPIGRDDTAEWIELLNTDSITVDLSGWTLRDASTGEFRIGSGILLASGQFLLLSRVQTHIDLSNQGERLSLWKHGVLIDALDMPALAEGVSYGRHPGTSAARMFCVPTPGAQNSLDSPMAMLEMQDGEIRDIERVSVNLRVEVGDRAPEPGECMVDFGDGERSDSCNPSWHSYEEVGTYRVIAQVRDACGGVSEPSLTIEVLPRSSSSRASSRASSRTSSIRFPSLFSSQRSSSRSSHPLVAAHETQHDEQNEQWEPEDDASPPVPGSILISEVSASGEEWVELLNVMGEQISLAGWSIDDIPDGGSRPHRLPDAFIRAGSFLLLNASEVGVALNDGGDAVQLLGPHGDVIDAVTYPKLKKGQTFNRVFIDEETEEFCVSDVSTPGDVNVCGGGTDAANGKLTTDEAPPMTPAALSHSSKKTRAMPKQVLGVKTAYATRTGDSSTDGEHSDDPFYRALRSQASHGGAPIVLPEQEGEGWSSWMLALLTVGLLGSWWFFAWKMGWLQVMSEAFDRMLEKGQN